MAEEQIDIIDEKEGKPSGKTASKHEAHNKGLWHRGAHIWIYNSKGQVLLQKRSMSCHHFPGLWDISSAGHVSAGEAPEQCAVRELKEELGLNANPGQFEKINVIKKKSIIKNTGQINNEFFHVYLFRFDGKISDLKLQKSEVEEVKFIPIAKLESDINDAEEYKKYVPHAEYYHYIIKEIRKRI